MIHSAYITLIYHISILDSLLLRKYVSSGWYKVFIMKFLCFKMTYYELDHKTSPDLAGRARRRQIILESQLQVCTLRVSSQPLPGHSGAPGASSQAVHYRPGTPALPACPPGGTARQQLA